MLIFISFNVGRDIKMPSDIAQAIKNTCLRYRGNEANCNFLFK